MRGEDEYSRFMVWKTACSNANRAWRGAAMHEKAELEPDGNKPPFPLTPEETEAARGYARFLGAVVLREFNSLVSDVR